MTGNPWAMFFWSDYESDKELKMCSLAAQGLWMRMLCICAEAVPAGFLFVNGKPVSNAALSRLVGQPVNEITELVDELELNGVFSRDRNGNIYNRRMVSKAKRRKTNQENGSKGGKVSARNKKGIFKSLGNEPEQKNEQELEQQAQPPTERTIKPDGSPMVESNTNTNNPPNPPGGDDGRDYRIDEVRKIVWRASGLTEEQIGTKLVSTSAEGFRQTRAWLALGLTVEEIRDTVCKAFDEAAEPIRNPWVYLDAVIKARSAAPPQAPVVDPKHGDRLLWRARLNAFKNRGLWLSSFGPDPTQPDCECDPEILAEFGYREAAA